MKIEKVKNAGDKEIKGRMIKKNR